MKEIAKQDWVDRIAPLHLPGQFTPALNLVFNAWKDPGPDPLGSMLEVFKYAMLAPLHGVRADVFAGQILLESGLGLKQQCLLGIKARAVDIADGKATKLRTLEILGPKDLAKLKEDGLWIEDVGAVLPDGRQEVRCLQYFYADTEDGNFDRYFQIYERHPERLDHLTTAADFLGNVTEKFYATGLNYARSIMGLIQDLQLGLLVLDKAPAPAAPATEPVDEE